jgi:hypothetical protein
MFDSGLTHAVEHFAALHILGQYHAADIDLQAALAEAKGLMIGAEKMDDTAIRATESSILERTREIEGLLR